MSTFRKVFEILHKKKQKTHTINEVKKKKKIQSVRNELHTRKLYSNIQNINGMNDGDFISAVNTACQPKKNSGSKNKN